MYFDGASSCEGVGDGVLFVAPKNKFIIPFSYILQWDIDYTNNVCQYKALVLGLEAARKLKIENLVLKNIHRMLVLKNNDIPKGIIPLERLFDHDDIPLKSTLQPQLEEVEYCNIGTKETPKLVKISKYLPPEMKRKYAKLIKKYKDVFS
jgi:hypothetical protein